MKSIIKINSDINRLGNEMVNCKLHCDKIENNPEFGAIPRGLYLETKNRSTGKGIIVVGMNPGKIQKNDNGEYSAILRKASSYENYKSAFETYVLYKNSYHNRIRQIIDALNFNGPILWTEIVKCQSENNGELPATTIRTCVHRFLKKEVELLDYPILALGDKAYNTCLLIFPERKVIGCSHPSGANVSFPGFFKNLISKKNKVMLHLDKLKDDGSVHLKDIL